jgi:hypothetical protein
LIEALEPMSIWNQLDASARQSLNDHVDEMTAFCEASQSAVHVLLDRGDTDVLQIEPSRLKAVPDRYFASEPSLAPHLLTLSAFDDKALVREILAAAVLQATDRRSPQGVGAVLLGPICPDALLAHFVTLGLQHDPEGAPRVFRYQDPRVMQRVWPTLVAAQRDFWLGPVRRWIAAMQPTGRIVDDFHPAPSLWHASPDGSIDPPFARPHRLLDAVQWRLAHSAPAEVAFWLLARQSMEAASVSRPYPATGELRGWLNDAATHHLDSNDQCEWALCRWAESPERWESVSGRQQVRDALELQRRHAGLQFADAWRTAGARVVR